MSMRPKGIRIALRDDHAAHRIQRLAGLNHEGTARVTQQLNRETVDVQANQQVSISLSESSPPQAIPQPKPVDTWSLSLPAGQDVGLGQWLPATESASLRLRAVPLLWPVPDRDPLLLHVIGIAAWKCSEQPVQLRSTSRLRFRGRTERPQTVRFGFSTQRLRGVFAGKFEVDVTPDRFGPPGETWDVVLPLTHFRPLHPQLASSADGLELADVYALTVVDDAGLEINDIELLPEDGQGSE